MKICYIANSASSHTKKWAEYFAEHGHDVSVISHSKDEIPNVKVYYIDYSLRNFIFKTGKVHKLIKEIKPDVLHAQQANTCGLYASTMRGYKFILSTWGSDILVGTEKSLILKKIVQHSVKRASFITSDSKYMSDKIIELGGDKDRIFTFPMGVEEELLNYRHNYNEDENMLKIISNRRLEKLYNIDAVILGFYEAIKENSNMSLTIAADGNERINLEGVVNKFDIGSYVRFTGKYKPDEVGKLLEPNDVFISVPSSDSTSVSLLECMAAGIFPVVSNLPANREWIEDGMNGIVLKGNNAREIKNALIWCSKNRDKMIEAQELNKKLIKDKGLWKNNARIVENLYNKLQGRK